MGGRRQNCGDGDRPVFELTYVCCDGPFHIYNVLTLCGMSCHMALQVGWSPTSGKILVEAPRSETLADLLHLICTSMISTCWINSLCIPFLRVYPFVSPLNHQASFARHVG